MGDAVPDKPVHLSLLRVSACAAPRRARVSQSACSVQSELRGGVARIGSWIFKVHTAEAVEPYLSPHGPRPRLHTCHRAGGARLNGGSLLTSSADKRDASSSMALSANHRAGPRNRISVLEGEAREETACPDRELPLCAADTYPQTLACGLPFEVQRAEFKAGHPGAKLAAVPAEEQAAASHHLHSARPTLSDHYPEFLSCLEEPLGLAEWQGALWESVLFL
ncbi:hypothetical protein EYF80_003302 [Liparis tanakae]|uniref:Uncharacterized protein n=1 Tax=Liparis tanakae TaxID=230148 RepID=A0A4Z2JAY3_9TELE|nr:hypothetical protein EYF80_003302 [Liparis tanakae]